MKPEINIWQNEDGTYEWTGNDLTPDKLIVMGELLTHEGLAELEADTVQRVDAEDEEE